jgi:putative phage-type endonuclease
MKAYREVDVKPHTPEWHAWRKKHITATSTAKILGDSPWGDASDVYNAMMGDVKIFETAAMQRGTELEPYARKFLEKKHGIALDGDVVVESTIHTFMGASLDAISKDRTRLFEIKCPGEKTMAKALQGEIDPQYEWQCQKQMFVMGLDEMKLFFYFNDYVNIEFEMKRRPNWIKELIEAEVAFYENHILPKKPPASKAMPIENVTTSFYNELARRRVEIMNMEAELKKEKEQIDEEIKKKYDKTSCLFVDAGLKYTHVERKGAIDWNSACMTWNITKEEQEKYRKENSSYCKFTVV